MSENPEIQVGKAGSKRVSLLKNRKKVGKKRRKFDHFVVIKKEEEEELIEDDLLQNNEYTTKGMADVFLPTKGNPWLFRNVEKYRFYVCPECDHVDRSVELFLRHARVYHPLSRQVFGPCKKSDCRTAKNDLGSVVNRVFVDEYKDYDVDTVVKQEETHLDDDPLEDVSTYRKRTKNVEKKLYTHDYNYLLSGDKESRILTRTPKEVLKKCDSEDEKSDLSVVENLEESGDNPEDKFQCYSCGEDLSPGTLMHVLQHLETYHDLFNTIHYGKPRPVHCLRCGATFRTAEELERHQARGHRNLFLFVCGQCGKKFTHKSLFEWHLKKMTLGGCQASRKDGETNLSCPECGMVFKRTYLLQRHRLKVHEKALPFSCERCGKMFVDQPNLDLHIETMHDDEVKKEECPHCGKLYGPRSLRKHLLAIKSYEKKRQANQDHRLCTNCGKVFKTGNTYSRHKRTCHLNPVKEYKCPYCPKLLKSKKYKIRHIENHKDEETIGQIERGECKRKHCFPCFKCRILFHNTADRDLHVTTCPHQK